MGHPLVFFLNTDPSLVMILPNGITKNFKTDGMI